MVRVSFIRDGISFEVPQLWIDSSATIRDMLADVELIEDHISLNVSIGVTSLEAMISCNQSQLILPVLDFLDCSIIIRVGMDIIQRKETLTELTKQLFYDIPVLAYQAYINGLLTPEELPPYSSIAISSEEWQEFIGCDHERLIVLINLRVPIELLLPEITTKMIREVDRLLTSNNLDDSVEALLIKLIHNLDRVNNQRLESLLRHFRYSLILDHMINLKQVEAIRRVHSDGLIPDDIDRIHLALNLESDEMVDLIMELKMNRTSFDSHTMFGHTYMITILRHVLKTNYLYPLKYVTDDRVINHGVECLGMSIMNSIEIRISVEGFRLLLPRIQPDLLHPLLTVMGFNNRHDLVAVIRETVTPTQDTIRYYSLLADFNSEAEYREYTNCDPVIDVVTIGTATTVNRYGGLLKSLIERSTMEERIQLLGVVLRLCQADSCHNAELLRSLTEMVTVEQFRDYSVAQLEIVMNEYDSQLRANMEAATIGDAYRVILITAIIHIRDSIESIRPMQFRTVTDEQVRTVTEMIIHNHVITPVEYNYIRDSALGLPSTIPDKIEVTYHQSMFEYPTRASEITKLVEPYYQVIREVIPW